MHTNIVFIGMAGVGKTTIATEIARQLDMQMIDIDKIIHRVNFMSCQEVIACYGETYFALCEENACLSVNQTNAAIATGGSVVYSDTAMHHLSDIGTIVYLEASYPTILERIEDPVARGVTGLETKTLEELYLERIPKYEFWAEITINTDNKTIEEVCEEIKAKLGETV